MAFLAKRFFRWWSDQWLLQIAVMLAMTTVTTIGYVDPDLITGWSDSDSNQTATSDDTSETVTATEQATQREQQERRQRLQNVNPFSVGDGTCVLVARWDSTPDRDFFDAESIFVMRRVVDEVQAMPQIAGTLWLNSVPDFNPFALPGTLLPRSHASQRQIQNARERVLSNPLAVGQLISADAQTLLVHLNLDWFFVRSDEDATSAIVDVANQAAMAATRDYRQTKFGKSSSDAVPAMRFQLTGRIPLYRMTAENHLQDSTRYQLIGYSLMLLSALVLFRGFSAVAIVAVSPAFGVYWTIGMLHFFDLQDNPFTDVIVPVLISLVGLTDAVHLMAEIRQQRAEEYPIAEAARRGVSRVGLACLLTSFTTAIGFVSLAWAHHEVVRQFGWCCVIGVMMTFISVLTITPLGCRSPLGRRLHLGMGKSVVEGQLKRIGPVVDFVIARDRWVSWIAIVSTSLLAACALCLDPDEKRYSGLSESGEAARALRHLDRALGGLEFGFVRVQWPEDATPEEILQVVEQCDHLMSQEPLIGNPIGVHDLLEALPGQGNSVDRMSLLELLPPSLKRAFYRPEYHQAWIQFRIQGIGIAAYHDTFVRMTQGIEQLADQHPGFNIWLDGSAFWRWKNIYQIVTDLAKSLATASVIIWIVLTIVYGSVRVGLISIVPNLFPLALTGTFLWASGQYLEISTVCVFTICLGIAVDDTIHFLTRYQEELRGGGDHDRVIRRAFTGVGSALLMTTIVLLVGLGSAILGDSRDARIFGIMGCLTLAAAFFADIVLLPALLSRYGLPRPTKTAKESQETGAIAD